MDLPDFLVRKAKEVGCRFAINTDAHDAGNLGHTYYGVAVARRAGLTKSDLWNRQLVVDEEGTPREFNTEAKAQSWINNHKRRYEMPDYWKYVVIGDDDMIIFPATMAHSQFKNMGKITSAGLIRIYPVVDGRGKDASSGIKCFGESVTLKIKSNPEHDERAARGLFVES
jgi:hypothetical protein